MVIIEIGTEMERFVVHSSYLCAKSPFFKTAVGSNQDGKPEIIRLPGVPIVLFRIFVAWMYHSCLCYLPPLGRTVDEDFESLKITKESLEQDFVHQYKAQATQVNPSYEESDSEDPDDDDVREAPPGPTVLTGTENGTAVASKSVESPAPSVANETKYLGDDPTGWPLHVFIQLYILADCFQVRELKADCLDALVVATEKQKLLLDLTYIQYIYSKTTEDSPLRKYVVHDTAYRRTFGKNASSYTFLPAEFLAAVMVTNSRRLPGKQCKECYDTALRSNEVLALHIDDRDLEQDLPLYKTDLCFYHEHLNEEDRYACRLRRGGPKPAA
jgi:hypothetical protein